PGDQVLFKAGTRFMGQLKLQGSGRMGDDGKPLPIRIGKYGEGALPRIDGEGQSLDTLLLSNVSFFEVEDLEITNQGTNREPWRTGVHLLADNSIVMTNVALRRLFVHDVNGDLRKNQEGCGIYFEARAARFDGLLIENCHVVHTDRN